MLVAGVVASAIMFQGIQAVALPMVQEFGYTKEIEDRVLAPLPVSSWWRSRRSSSGAIQGLLAALIVFPIAAVVPRDDRCTCRSTGRCCSRWRRSPAMAARRWG